MCLIFLLGSSVRDNTEDAYINCLDYLQNENEFEVSLISSVVILYLLSFLHLHLII